jgi:hypothetical protein
LGSLEQNGFAYKDYGDPEVAKLVANRLGSLILFSFENEKNYGVLVVRDTIVNAFSYWPVLSSEEEKIILERRKREWNSKQKRYKKPYKRKNHK